MNEIKNKICGIYCIENIINHKKYIGQSIDIYARWYNHKYCLNNSRHSNSYLQNAWNKYGECNFIFKILEECNENNLDEKEVYYITKFQTLIDDNGYNLDGGGSSNKHHSEITKRKISNSHKGKILSDITRQRISQNRKGKMTGKDHPLYGKKLSKEHAEMLRQYAKSRYGDKCYQAKKVICVNTGEIFNTIKDAVKKYVQYGVYEANVSKCCKGKRSHCGVFNNGEKIIWRYYSEGEEYSCDNLNLPAPKTMKSVNQYDIDGNFIATYPSVKEAGEITGILHTMISRVCRGERKQTHGYIFKYSEEQNNIII